MDIQKLREAAEQRFSGTFKKMNGSVDIAGIVEFLAAANDVGPYDGYKVFPQRARDIVENVRLKGGDAECRLFLRSVISKGIVDTLDSDRFRKLPPRVATQQSLQLARIACDSDDQADWLAIENDLFHKEFGIATMRLYVAGAELVDFRCGIPRSIIFREGLLGAPVKLFSILKLGGFRPYFQVHMHKFMRDLFNEEGREECYRCCAELYDVHPEILGMFGSSWFYDPVLESVSPRLAYLRTGAMEAGARLFFVEKGGDAVNSALSTSPTRRKLYKEGRYIPKSYMLVWAKKQQIAWSKRT